MPFLLFWMIVGIWQLVFNTFGLTIATDKPIVVLICWLGWVLSRFLNLFLLVVLLSTFLMPLRMIVMVRCLTGFVLFLMQLVSWFLYISSFTKKKSFCFNKVKHYAFVKETECLPRPQKKKKNPKKLSHRIYFRPLQVVSRDVQIEFKNHSPFHYTHKFIHLLPSNNKNIKKDRNVNYINKNIGLNCTPHIPFAC